MEANPQLVLMNRRLAGFEERCVYFDDYTGGRLAARHLVAKGHRQIATIAGPESYFQANDRLRGFIDELREAGVDLQDDRIVRASFGLGDGARAFGRLVDRDPA